MWIVSRPAEPGDRSFVRARFAAGFGCIRCGSTIYHYCAVADEEPAEGEAAELFLLCPDCRGRLEVMDNGRAVLAILRERPVSRQRHFDRRALPYMADLELPDVIFPGGAVLRRKVFPVMLGDHPVFGLSPAELLGAPVRVDIALGAGSGVLTTLVRENEWLVRPGGGWRLAFNAYRCEIRSDDGEAWLVLTFRAGSFHIHRLRSRWVHHILEIDANGVRFDDRTIDIGRTDLGLIGLQFP